MIIASIVTLGIILAMIRINITDIPCDRSSHTHPIPKGAGVAIMLGAFTYFFAAGGTYLLTPQVMSVLGCSILMGIVGLADDIKHISFKVRLVLQLICAYIVYDFGLRFGTLVLPGHDSIELGKLSPYLTIFWIVGFTNAFNFMDGLNGMAAGGAAVAALFLLLLSPVGSVPSLLLMGLFLSLIVFLPFNFPKAKIFMGDAGSQFIGFMLACIAVVGANTPDVAGNLNLWSVLLIFLPFLFDTGYTLLRRLYKRRNIFQAHREHIFQLLNRSGWDHPYVSALYMTMIALHGVLVWTLAFLPNVVRTWTLYLSLMLFLLIVSRIVIYLARRKGVEV